MCRVTIEADVMFCYQKKYSHYENLLIPYKRENYKFIWKSNVFIQ